VHLPPAEVKIYEVPCTKGMEGCRKYNYPLLVPLLQDGVYQLQYKHMNRFI